MGSANPREVFLVDDDPGVLKALSRVLREAGYAVETYESGVVALATMRNA